MGSLRKPRLQVADVGGLDEGGIGGERALSLAIVETILLGVLLVLAVNTPLTLVAQRWGLRFELYGKLSVAALFLCLVAAVAMQAREIRGATHRDYRTLGYLLLLGVCCAGLASVVVAITGDHCYYICNAVYYLEHPQAAMDFVIHFVVGRRGAPIVSPFQGTSTSYDYMRAVLAQFLHVDYQGLFRFSGILAAFTLPLAYYALISQFSRDPRILLAGTLFCVALVLVGLDGGNALVLPGGRSAAKLAFWYPFYGKFWLLTIGIPLIVGFSIKFLARPSIIAWVFVFAAATASVSMSPSSMLLMPLLAVVLFASFMLAILPGGRTLPPLKDILVRGALYASSFAYLLLYGLYSYRQSRLESAAGDPYDLSGPADFLGQIRTFSSLKAPIMPILIVLSLVLVAILLRGRTRTFILFWSAFLLVFFLNPFAVNLMIDTVVPRNIYWRLFYLLPFPLGLALVAARVSSQLRRWHMVIPLTSLVLGIGAYCLVASHAKVLRSPFVQRGGGILVLAQQIAAIAPPGPMLAPPQLYTAIPMVSGTHPQMSVTQPANVYWLGRGEAQKRQYAAQFVAGNLKHIGEFNQVLREGFVDTIVLNNVIFGTPLASDVRRILQQNGFVRQQLVESYLVVWK